jgi:CubicO group peptidase (beta-lactamase class C family)
MLSILQQAVHDQAFPGAVWRVYHNQKLLIEEKVGCLTYESKEPVSFQTRYDLASVTKPIVSVAVLMLADQGLIKLNERASYYLELLNTADKRDITVAQLLTHTAGLVSYPELYTKHSDPVDLYEQLFNYPRSSKIDAQVAYTSIGYQYLGYIVEKVTGTSLKDFLSNHMFKPLHMKQTEFTPTSNQGIAPTEYSDLRERILVGEVHDDNAYLLGGVCGHAGLFSNLEDMCSFGQALLDTNNPLMSEEMTNKLFLNITEHLNLSRSYAFAINDSEFGAWRTQTFSHTGFTGTSLFLVPEQQLVSVLLTNRVYPTRSNWQIRAVRARLHAYLQEIVKG